MQDLVDGHTHEAWTNAAAGLLRQHPGPQQSGAEWQAAIRYEFGCVAVQHDAIYWHIIKMQGLPDAEVYEETSTDPA